MASFISRDVANIPDSMELNYQRYLVNVSMLVGLPVLSIFMIYDLIIGRYLIGTVLALMFVLLLCLFVAINKPGYKTKESRRYSYFLNTLFLLFGFFIAYTVGVEGNLSRMPWAFLFTVLVFFALGRPGPCSGYRFCFVRCWSLSSLSAAMKVWSYQNLRRVFISLLCW